MKRLPKQLISMLIVLCMVASFFGVLASADTVTTATLVTDVSSLKAGDQIIIVASGNDYALSTTQNSNNRGQAAVTRVDASTVTVGADTQIITLEAGASDGTFAFSVGEGSYLYAASSSKNYLRTTSTLDGNASWAITIDAATGVAGIVASGTNTRNTMKYNKSSGLFACYASGQIDVTIYKVTGTGEGGDSGEGGDVVEPTGSTATLVTDGTKLNAGDQIIIVATDADFALSSTQNTNNRGQAAVVKGEGTVTYYDDAQIITLAEGAVEGTLALSVAEGSYLYAASNSANYLKTTATLDENASWNIDVDATTGIASIVAAGANGRNTLRYNSGSSLFSCYAPSNTMQDIAIYMVTDTEGTGGSTGGSGEEPDVPDTPDVTYTATLVTDGTILNAGDQIIIVAAEADFALSTTQNTNNRVAVAITKNEDSTVTFGADVQIITLAAGATDTTLSMTVGEGQYLYAASNSSNYLRTTTELTEDASWTINLDTTTYAAAIVAAGANSKNVVRYNSSSSLFSCYGVENTMGDVNIYMVADTANSGGATGGNGGTDVPVEPDVPEVPDADDFGAILVTDLSQLSIGDQIIIVAAGYDFALSSTQNTNNRGQAAVIKNTELNTLTFGSDTELITLESGNLDGTYAFGVGTSQFLYAPSSSSNHLKTDSELTDNGSWTISIDSATGIATITSAGTSTRNTLRYNSSSKLFSCYASNTEQPEVSIYLVTGSATSGDTTENVGDAGNSDSTCNHNWSNGVCTNCGEAYILMITNPTGYTSADQVVYNIVDGYIANWGARGEEILFLSTYATEFYTGEYTFAVLSDLAGGTSTSNAASSELYDALQALMGSKHVNYTKYSSSSNSMDARYFYLYTDCLNGDTTNVSTIYRGLLVNSAWDGGTTYNQEHIWPNSKCIGTTSTDIGDIMHLRPANPSENSSRGNTAYGESAGYYDPGLSVRGDVARTVLYLYTRWGNTNLFGSDGVIESLDILLKWIEEDPVDTWEMGRNDAVQSITGTRNVFVDYPEYAWLLFGEEIPADLTTPSGGESTEPVANDYYLIGYINGANYGCEEDYENMGQYKFVDGTLVATFDTDSYVFIKTGDNANWYMSQSYVTDTTGTFYNTSTGTSEKMLVPGGVELTFTLTVNDDGSLTLSYAGDLPCKHPIHNMDGLCIDCSQIVEHTYVDGICSICGAEQPVVIEPGYYVAGNFNGWIENDPAYKMTEYNGNYQAYFSIPAGVLELKVTDGTWDNNWPTENYKAYNGADATICVTFNPITKEITVDGLIECVHGNHDVDGNCTTCGAYIGHNFVDRMCVCGTGLNFYLEGYINGADYTGKDYYFTDDRIVLYLDVDSYIYVTDTEGNVYMTETYVDGISGTFYKGGTEKMFLAANTQHIIDLYVNEDGSVTLELYQIPEEPVVIPTLTLNYPTLAFEAEILYNAYFTVSDASSVVEFGMVTFSSRLVDGTIADAVDIIPGYATAGN
ncbi:MAG: hypothetical protein E7466_06410, partial [Ruminococcaceae bacterium]|nr:hypothetical protein [Oscillospiraceae bacterium]